MAKEETSNEAYDRVSKLCVLLETQYSEFVNAAIKERASQEKLQGLYFRHFEQLVGKSTVADAIATAVSKLKKT